MQPPEPTSGGPGNGEHQPVDAGEQALRRHRYKPSAFSFLFLLIAAAGAADGHLQNG